MQTMALQKARPLLIVTVAVLSVTAGFLIVLEQRSVWGIIAALLFVVLLAKALYNLNASLFLLFASFVLTDLFRRLFAAYTGNWGPWGLLAIDVALVICFLSLYSQLLRRGGKSTKGSWQFHLPNTFQILLSFYALYVLVELFNPYYPSLLLSLAAFRDYLLPLPAIGLGLFVAQRWDQQQWRRVYRIVLSTVIGLVLLALLQLFLDASYHERVVQALLQPAEHPVHSWGLTNVRLTSATFASSKRFGRFLLFTFPLVWAYLKRSKNAKTRIVTSLLYLLGASVSGSREAVWLLILMILLLEGWRKTFTGISIAVISFGFLLTMLFGVNGILQRLSFMLSTPQDWLDRIIYMFLSVPRLMFEGGIFVDVYLFGHGAGRGGQASRLVAQQISPVIVEGGVRDAGLYKIFFDLGIIGLALFVFLLGYLVIKAWPLRSELRADPFYLASGVAVIMWIFLFFKAHTTISDQMLNIFFWSYVGVLMAKSQSATFGRD